MMRALLFLLLFPAQAFAIDYWPCEYEQTFYVDDSDAHSDAGQVLGSLGDIASQGLQTPAAATLLDYGVVHPVREGWYSVDIQAVHDAANEFHATDGDTLTLCLSKADTSLTLTATDACVDLVYSATSPAIVETLNHVLLDQPLWALELETVSDIGAGGSPDLEALVTVRLRRHACATK